MQRQIQITALFALAALAACKPLPKDQAHFAKGYDAYQSGDFYTALLYLKPLVEEGHPASELLLAKMYANGQGVSQDIGKAELLRNLAAAKIYAHPLPPGKVVPANAALKAVQDRIDYYAEGPNANKKPPVQDLSQLLTTLDLNQIRSLAATDFENPMAGEVAAAPVEREAAPDFNESRPPAVSNVPGPTVLEAATPVEKIDLSHTREAQNISLTLLRQSAENGDALAMQLLSAAYTQGHYGLAKNRVQADAWRDRARKARLAAPDAVEEEGERDPSVAMGRMAAVMGAGLLLMGAGGFLAWKRRKRMIK